MTKKAENNGSHSNSRDHENGDHASSSHSHDSASSSGHAASDHIHGVNGGHIFKFEPADFSGEWLQSRNSDLIRLFILDSNSKKNKPVVANVVVKRGDSIFSLDPENTDDSQASSMFSLDDQELAIAMNLGVSVEMTIGDKKYIGKIEPSKPHRH